MRGYHGLSVALVALLPAVADAACEPGFVDGSNVVTLTPSGSFDDQRLVERFYVRVQNTGSDACTLRLAVGRDIAASDRSFPDYTLTGPNGNIPIVALPAAASNPNVSVPLTVPAGGQVQVAYDVRLDVGWGSEAGTYGQELVYQLFRPDSRAEIADQRTSISLNVPTAARIRFAGTSGGREAARLEMGVLSPTTPTVSPPFAIRVLSTSGYQMQLESENAGALQRTNGPERIPYRMSVDNRPLNLAGGGGLISVARHTGRTGDVHPVSVVVDPDPARHAGQYSDRVTVTVTPI